MGLIKQNCNVDLLKRSLNEQLSQDIEERLIAHLDECSECRRSLKAFAGGVQDWSTIEQALKSDHDAETLHWSAVSDSPAPIPTDFAVDFLHPSDRPNCIGRLDDIEIESVIGQGGNGIVLKGYQPELKRLVAVKVMAPTLAATAAARQRFSREAQATAAVVHPNVMPILTVHSAGQLPYLVMPFADCESLQQRLDRIGTLDVKDVLRIAHQVANGLAAAHAQGLVHRDVKPAIHLLEKQVIRVMLTDFGLARAADDASLTRTGLIAGTPAYMSPEQARGDSVDSRSDLFSLGSVIYAMATGRPPFRAETVYGILRRVTDEIPRPAHEVNSQIPLWLSVLIARFQHPLPSDRISDAETGSKLLQDCLAHVQQPAAFALPSSVKQMQSDANRQKWAKRLSPIFQWPQLLIACLVVAVIVLLVPLDKSELPKTLAAGKSVQEAKSDPNDNSNFNRGGPPDSTTKTNALSGRIDDKPNAVKNNFSSPTETIPHFEFAWHDDIGSTLTYLQRELQLLKAEVGE